MTAHLTPIVVADKRIQVVCDVHDLIAEFSHTIHGINAAETTARAHDDLHHGTYWPEGAYRRALIALNESREQ